ncbi:hypothetical protein GJ496_011988 [Pomphorhynchus laevis]|nr:hypothetical protein GJ496_011988 [Pomphorhynchus laevis]
MDKLCTECVLGIGFMKRHENVMIRMECVLPWNAYISARILHLCESKVATQIGSTYNYEKWDFGSTGIKMLVYLVSQRKLHPDTDRLSALLKLPTPSDMKALKRVIGMFTYYSSWIEK